MTPQELAKVLNLMELPRYLRRTEAKIARLSSAGIAALDRPISRLVTAGGKRLRPVLVIGSAAAAGAEISDKVIQAAAVVELVHLASLIHDDLIDHTANRRGRPSVNQREGPALAVLAGDFLLAKACQTALSISPLAGRLIAGTISEMAVGVAVEATAGRPKDPLNRQYKAAAGQKTASLMSAASQLGGAAAGINKDKLAGLAAFGKAFGLAFQLIDDIKDGEFDPAAVKLARRSAQTYCAAAADSLSVLKSPRTSGLANLPDYYLDWALDR